MERQKMDIPETREFLVLKKSRQRLAQDTGRKGRKMKFRESKYTDPTELAEFTRQLENAVKTLKAKHPLASSQKHRGKTGIELWPLLHHTTLGKYYVYNKPAATPVELWIGLDLAEEYINLIIWFEDIDLSFAQKLVAALPKTYFENFGCYRRDYLNQFWFELKESEFSNLMNCPANAQKIIEDFFKEVLNVI
jgi:hypothetical protein